MSSSAKAVIAIVLLWAPVRIFSAATVCFNDMTYKYNDAGRLRPCSNIRLNETRRQTLCQITAVRDACPQTCGICCEDDPTFTFPLDNLDKSKNCEWIIKNNIATRRANYCSMQDYIPVAQSTIRNMCPKACDFCFSLVAVGPTTSPTKAPNMAPITNVDDPTITTNHPSASPTLDTTGNWAFLVLADTHLFDYFSWFTLEKNKQSDLWKTLSRILSSIRSEYGEGDLVLLPGDQVGYGRNRLQTFIDRFGGSMSAQEAIYKASVNAHSTVKALLHEVGYDTVLATIGDHDIGGNEGFVDLSAPKSKLLTLPSHRQGFGDGINRDEDGEFLFGQSFHNIPSRPLETKYENTTFAYVHHNALFVTVDAFELVGDGTKNYLDRANGFGGEGAVTCTVSGKHLDWFESILKHGRESAAINHIFVQAHLPVIQPVQKVTSTGQFFDGGSESNFWNLMNEYGVDVYFAGDVHANTATKSSYDGSNLVQVVSRGVGLNNFLNVEISKDIIDIKIYNEYGDDWRFNGQYKESGHLTIDKSSEMIEISSSGMLKLLDVKSEIISFDFEEIHPLGTRQVLSMGDRDRLIPTEVTIRNKLCKDSMFNKGGFGAQYDAQISNITLVEGRDEGGLVGFFTEETRFGLYGSGPFSAGDMVSLGVWIRTTEAERRMVLVHYANYWGSFVQPLGSKDHFTFTLDKGVPVINTQPLIHIRPDDEMNLADGLWHHVAISMPRKSCLVSELEIYVDGMRIAKTRTVGDRHIFHVTSGRMSLGGFGYSNRGFEDAYPGAGPFIGTMDDFVMFARPLEIRRDFPSLFRMRMT